MMLCNLYMCANFLCMLLAAIYLNWRVCPLTAVDKCTCYTTCLMCLQAQNVWRKRAFQVMQAHHTKYGQTTSAGADTKLLGALDIFRQRVDHSVENTVPTNKKFSEKIKVMVAKAAETGLLEVM
jgi:hypothetical protein